MDGDRAHRATAVVVAMARVRLDAAATSTECTHARHDDRAAALATRDPAERVLRAMLHGAARLRAARREALLDREPRRIVDDAPFRTLDRDQLVRPGLHAHHAATLPDLLDPPVHV